MGMPWENHGLFLGCLIFIGYFMEIYGNHWKSWRHFEAFPLEANLIREVPSVDLSRSAAHVLPAKIFGPSLDGTGLEGRGYCTVIPTLAP